jgi:uncharacterized protein YjiS (DUF1127 family)
MVDHEELEPLIRNYWRLTPAERDLLRQRVEAQAKILRAEMLRSLFRQFLFWRRRRSAVAQLSALDERMLKDIGLHRSEIESAVRAFLPNDIEPGRYSEPKATGYGPLTPAL